MWKYEEKNAAFCPWFSLNFGRFSHYSCLWLSSYQRRTFELSYEGCYTKVHKTTASPPHFWWNMWNLILLVTNYTSSLNYLPNQDQIRTTLFYSPMYPPITRTNVRSDISWVKRRCVKKNLPILFLKIFDFIRKIFFFKDQINHT